MTRTLGPVLLGAIMAPMMLWLLHGRLTSGTGPIDWAVIAFAAAHLVAIAVALAGAVLAARLSPRARHWLGRLHRPSFRHAGLMVGAALLTAGLIHVGIHGGVQIG